MKRTPRVALTSAAIAGLISGAAFTHAYGDTTNKVSTNSPPSKTSPGKPAAAKEPKVHDCAGTNDCKGLGGCKSGDAGCKFKNTCKGKGGCELTKKDITDWKAKHKEAAAKPAKT